MTADPFDLQRFLDAQAETYATARAELAHGHKRSHWMWFVFPQIRGLGHSAMSRRYAISGLAEAQAYLNHPELGPRLVDCTQLVLAARPRSLDVILGHPDDLKFHSSMTLYSVAGGTRFAVFGQALAAFFGGTPDTATLRCLHRG